MRNIKAVLKLRAEGLSQVQTAAALKVARSSVQEYERRCKIYGLELKEAQEKSEEELERIIFPPLANKKQKQKALPDFNYLAEELRRPNATLAVLWEEYMQETTVAYSYTVFCAKYREYAKKLNYSMRQEHKAGEKTFVDFGTGLYITDPKTWIKKETQLFVSVWGASNYTYAQSVYDETLANWIMINVRALEYFGCCPKAVVPDNLKSAVIKACKYEPHINPTYLEFANHYNTVIYPARPHRPKDKAKVENGVKLAKRWILFRLRNQTFYSLKELNDAILELLEKFNNRKMKGFGKSRKELFDILDKPHAKILPEIPFEYAEWKKVRVGFNYHIQFEKHNYSVPYTYIHKTIEVRATATVIELYFKGVRIYSHRRSYINNGFTTIKEHMPIAHQRYVEWTPERIIDWAEKSGNAVKELVTKLIESRQFPEQAYKSCLGIMRLENKFTKERLNNACARALEHRTYSYKSIVVILEKSLDKKQIFSITKQNVLEHENVRGVEYYNTELFSNDIRCVSEKN